MPTTDRSTDAAVAGPAQGRAGRRARSARVVNRLIGNRFRFVLISLGVIFVVGGIAVAAPTGDFVSSSGPTGGLVKAGPVDPVNGFPAWYRDSTGLDLEGCMSALDPNCGAVPVPDPTQPTAFPGNFPDEFFYMDATASLTANGGGKVLAQFSLEGAFLNGIVPGDQMVFSRIRYKIDKGLAGSTNYTITQPYGIDVVKSGPAASTPSLFVTQDVGATAGAFTQALGGRVGPFLQWAPNPADPADVPPTGYVGDAVTPHKVTGSAVGTNFVRIEGPGIGGPVASNPNPCTTSGPNAYTGAPEDCIETDLFTLIGKKSTTGGVDVARASYSKTAAGATQIDVFAGSKLAQDIVVRDPAGGTTPRFPITPLRGQDGRYYARVDVTGTLPDTVEVVNRADIPPTVKTVPVKDLVTGSAAYDTATNTLHVQGMTSDKSSTAPTLSVPAFTTTLDATGAGDIALQAPPDSVTIDSTAGGSMTVPVEAQGTPLAPLPLVANAGPDQTVEQGTVVTLDASNSTGNITGYQWSPPAGVTLSSTITKVTTFTATTPGDYTINLTVQGIDGTPPGPATAQDSVVVHVNPIAAAPVAKIALVGPAIPQNWPVTLDGTPSTGAATYQWDYVPATGDPTITLGPTDQPKLTCTFPKTTRTLTFRLTVCNAAGPPVCNSTTVALSGQPDTLTVARARFNGGRWVVAGTATSTLQNSVVVHAGSTTDGPVIGTAPVDAVGGYQLDVRNSPVPANTRVSLESARGGVLLNQAVR